MTRQLPLRDDRYRLSLKSPRSRRARSPYRRGAARRTTSAASVRSTMTPGTLVRHAAATWPGRCSTWTCAMTAAMVAPPISSLSIARHRSASGISDTFARCSSGTRRTWSTTPSGNGTTSSSRGRATAIRSSTIPSGCRAFGLRGVGENGAEPTRHCWARSAPPGMTPGSPAGAPIRFACYGRRWMRRSRHRAATAAGRRPCCGWRRSPPRVGRCTLPVSRYCSRSIRRSACPSGSRAISFFMKPRLCFGSCSARPAAPSACDIDRRNHPRQEQRQTRAGLGRPVG
jgi:hypothetical protein